MIRKGVKYIHNLIYEKVVAMEDKLQVVLELQEQGKNRTEIWKALGYTKCSGLTRYMDSKGYKYNEQENKYEFLEVNRPIKKQENNNQKLINEIQELKDENKNLLYIIQELKDEIHKLKNEDKKRKFKKKNERGAGRHERLTGAEKESIKMYRVQGKTIKEIAELYKCSVGLIHKIINENDKAKKIKCNNCGHTFEEEVNLLGYEYTRGICCPKCARDIEMHISLDGKVKTMTCGIDTEFN